MWDNTILNDQNVFSWLLYSSMSHSYACINSFRNICRFLSFLVSVCDNLDIAETDFDCITFYIKSVQPHNSILNDIPSPT